MRAQAYAQRRADEETILSFKRHILSSSQHFAAEPEEDLFRVNLLAQMLDRYDALAERGLSGFTCSRRVLDEFSDIPARMREAGFVETDAADDGVHARWPRLGDAQAQRYIEERDAYLHKTSLGIMMCTACVVPLLIAYVLSEAFFGYELDVLSLLGVAGMFGMIGMGVYAITSARKPTDEKKIKRGEFSLSAALRRHLSALRQTAKEKARRRRGRGIAMLSVCVLPVLLGAALDTLWAGEIGSVLGVCGMFVMIGAGVYELVMADGEKTTFKRLLGKEEE